MSVVNQMLRDLQQRQESVKQLPLQPLLKNQNPNFKYWVIFICILILSIFYFWIIQSDSNHEPEFFVQNQAAIKNLSLIPVVEIKTNSIISTEQEQNEATSNIQAIINQPKIVVDEIIATQVKIDNTDTINSPSVSNHSVSNQKTLAINNPTSSPTITTSDKVLPLKNTKNKNTIEPIIKQQSNETILNNQLEEIKNDFSFVGYSQTKDALLKLLLTHPDFHSARLYLIMLAWQQNDLHTTQLIHNAIEQFPNLSAFRLAAGRYFLEQSDYQQAEQSLLNIKPTSDNLSELLQMRAVIRQKNNKHQLAVEDYTSILRITPDRGDIYIALGISLEILNQPEQALQSFKKAELDQRLSKRQLLFVKNKIQQISQNSQLTQYKQG